MPIAIKIHSGRCSLREPDLHHPIANGVSGAPTLAPLMYVD
jgi:hypothetical protein